MKITSKALAKDPSQRYQTCEDFAYDLRVALRGLRGAVRSSKFEDVFDYAKPYSFGSGHLRIGMNMPVDFPAGDAVMFQFIFVNPETGLHATALVPNEYGDAWQKIKEK